ncbi:hypothetical protein ACFYWX_30500 [Streptomyces sp. NPDC002888]|uniref:hypothetical protein n=1 Tax=Streptomyces sp. NPDC002888 TaxID=3364668 RepID=UPI003681D356
MAFEYGVLGRSGGRSALAALEQLLDFIEAEDTDVSRGEITPGDGWAATDVRIRRPGEQELEQYVQVSVGGEIPQLYVELATATSSEIDVTGVDLMLNTTLSKVTDPVVNDLIQAYALPEWNGILWDETSGFHLP